MKITSFEYHDEKQPGWNYAKIELHSINLFVGETGSGKTRLLNTIFDIGVFVTQGSVFKAGKWIICLENDSVNYQWIFEGKKKDNDTKGIVLKEKLIEIQGNEECEIIVRDGNDFLFNGEKLPKLASDMCGIFLLKEEAKIAPIHQVFSRILRRSFHDVGLSQSLAYANIPSFIDEELKKNKSLEVISMHDLPVSLKLFFLKKYFKSIYEELCSFYKSIFPTIESCTVSVTSKIAGEFNFNSALPIFEIKEKHVNKHIHLQELSAGMQKVLLIMTDIIALPKNSIYLIDEYENSLGINAIDFLPSFLADYGDDKQFIITTHHPYLINNMPIVNWQVFHRKGSNVTIKNGSEYINKFGQSKQKAFIQLINDPFYSEGVE